MLFRSGTYHALHISDSHFESLGILCLIMFDRALTLSRGSRSVCYIFHLSLGIFFMIGSCSEYYFRDIYTYIYISFFLDGFVLMVLYCFLRFKVYMYVKIILFLK